MAPDQARPRVRSGISQARLPGAHREQGRPGCDVEGRPRAARRARRGRSTARGSRGHPHRAHPVSRGPMRSTAPAISGWTWKCLWALTWSSGRPVARKASNCAAISAASWRRAAGFRARSRPRRSMSRADQAGRVGQVRQVRGRQGRPASTSTRCSPTRRRGIRLARATASAAAGAADHQARGGEDAVAMRLLDGLVDLGARPKSSAVTTRCFTRLQSRVSTGGPLAGQGPGPERRRPGSRPGRRDRQPGPRLRRPWRCPDAP